MKTKDHPYFHLARSIEVRLYHFAAQFRINIQQIAHSQLFIFNVKLDANFSEKIPDEFE